MVKPILIFNMFFAFSVMADQIAVFCYHHYEGIFARENSFPLVNSDGKSILYEARFSEGSYYIEGEDFADAEKKCREQTKAKSLDYSRLMGATRFGAKLYQDNLGAFARHYPVLDGGNFANMIRTGQRAFDGLPDEKFEIDIFVADSTRYLAKAQQRLATTPDSGSVDDLLSEQVFIDFNRSDSAVLVDNKIVYRNKGAELLDIAAEKFVNQALDQRDFARLCFAAVENHVVPTVKSAVDAAQLRRHIALALESRTQGFEEPVTTKMRDYFMKSLPLQSKYFGWKFDNVGRAFHSFAVEDDLLIITTRISYLMEVSWAGVRAPIGTIDSLRRVTMNLITGSFSKEVFTLKKQ